MNTETYLTSGELEHQCLISSVLNNNIIEIINFEMKTNVTTF